MRLRGGPQRGRGGGRRSSARTAAGWGRRERREARRTARDFIASECPVRSPITGKYDPGGGRPGHHRRALDLGSGLAWHSGGGGGLPLGLRAGRDVPQGFVRGLARGCGSRGQGSRDVHDGPRGEDGAGGGSRLAGSQRSAPEQKAAVSQSPKKNYKASPGPHDANVAFDQFVQMVKEGKGRAGA